MHVVRQKRRHEYTQTVDVVDVSPVHGLVCCAGNDGVLECIDARQSSTVGSLDVASALEKVRRGLEPHSVEGRHLWM